MSAYNDVLPVLEKVISESDPEPVVVPGLNTRISQLQGVRAIMLRTVIGAPSAKFGPDGSLPLRSVSVILGCRQPCE